MAALAALAGLAPRGVVGHGFMADPPAQNYIATVSRFLLISPYPWLHKEKNYLGGKGRCNIHASDTEIAAVKETLPYPKTCPHCLSQFLAEPNEFELEQISKY